MLSDIALTMTSHYVQEAEGMQVICADRVSPVDAMEHTICRLKWDNPRGRALQSA